MLSDILNLPAHIKAYSVVAIGYPAEGIDMEAVDRFDETRIHYNKYE
jgi:hypothetical protein